MAPAQIETRSPSSGSGAFPRSLSGVQDHSSENKRLNDLRGVQWRINLGVLPSSSETSIHDLRRVTADSRRRYAGLRRRLLVDPHISDDSTNIIMDNPLSQNPDSTWGRFFRNAELGKMVDQDLSRLYPEQGSYFQTQNCQGMLRRILLLWCLQHPEIGYRQGMHELLAPLLYVLHVDANRLSQVRKLYEDHFTDKFDDLSGHDSDHLYNLNFKRPPASVGAENTSHISSPKVKSLDDLDPEIRTIVLLSDAYGAEGELGIVLSEKFMEHDAYCMFDALMIGNNGAIAMADFFSPSPASGSHTGMPPVIEASTALYHLLSLVDSSLHTHLVELGVEPQYFALRWLRVLFGREFALEYQLIIWDEIFAADNNKLGKGNDAGFNLAILCSSRGAFISAMSVAMLLYLRSSLLATEHATSCLQRLLNFPENVHLKKLIEKAKSLQNLALKTDISSLSSLSKFYSHDKLAARRAHSLSLDFSSPKTPPNLVPESYWEEKWRVVHIEEELKKGDSKKQTAVHKRGWSDKVRFLSRTESDPSPAAVVNGRKETKSTVRRKLLQDLSKVLVSEEDAYKLGGEKDGLSRECEVDRQDDSIYNIRCTSDKVCSSENVQIGETSSLSSDPTSPLSRDDDREINEESRSSVGSSGLFERDGNSCHAIIEDEPLPVSHHPGYVCGESIAALPVLHDRDNNDHRGKRGLGRKDQKLLSGKFLWLWKLGHNGDGTSTKGEMNGGDSKLADSEISSSIGGTSTKGELNGDDSKLADGQRNGTSILSSSIVDFSSSIGSKDECRCNGDGTSSNGGINCDHSKLADGEINRTSILSSSTVDDFNSSIGSKDECSNQNVMGPLRSLGQSMLEHIQVIESVFQQDRQMGAIENLDKNGLVGNGQATAMAALKELQKISNLISEM